MADEPITAEELSEIRTWLVAAENLFAMPEIRRKAELIERLIAEVDGQRKVVAIKDERKRARLREARKWLK